MGMTYRIVFVLCSTAFLLETLTPVSGAKNTKPVYGICPHSIGIGVCLLMRGTPCKTDFDCTEGMKCCPNQCGKHICKTVSSIKDRTERPMECWLEKNDGYCDKHVSKYYYDQNKKDCYHFRYKGCGGNSNRFDTRQECRENCKVKGHTKTSNTKPSIELNGWILVERKFTPKDKPGRLVLSRVRTRTVKKKKKSSRKS